MSNIAIIGDGGWGTALALVLHRNGHHVRIWGPFADYVSQVKRRRENTKFLPGVRIPEEIDMTSDRALAVDGADVVVIAVPSKFYKPVLQTFASIIPSSCRVISVSKGLDPETHERLSVTAEKTLGRGSIAVLSGPSHAEEVGRRIPTAVVISCQNHDAAKELQQIFNGPEFRIYTSDDTIGTELGGALKNVIAIGAGVSDGIGFGDNTKAALITRGLAEITRLGVAMGAQAATFSGLSGVGDLIVTCASNLSRNRGVGERLGQGEKIEDILKSMEQVAEGVWTCKVALKVARQLNIEVPLTEQVHAIIYEGKNPKQAVQDLMTRDPRQERD